MKIAFHEVAQGVERLSDTEFLRSICWKRTTPAPIRRAAQNGNIPLFCRCWLGALGDRCLTRSKIVPAAAHTSVLWSRSAFDEPDTQASGKTKRLATEAHSDNFGQHTVRRVSVPVASPHREETLIRVLERLEAPGNKRATGRQRAIHIPSSGLQKRKQKHDASQHVVAQLSEFLTTHESNALLTPIELLTLFQILSRYGGMLDVEMFWRLWRLALSGYRNLSKQHTTAGSNGLTIDQHLLLDGELPWQFGLLFAEIDGATDVRRSGCRVLRKQLLDQTDTDGTPKATLLDRLPYWLAPLVRSGDSALRFDERLWNAECRERFESLVRVVSPLCLADGGIALSNGSPHHAVFLLQTAASLLGISQHAEPQRYLLGIQNGRLAPQRDRLPTRIKSLTDDERPATQSDWAQLACLRTDWSVGANTVVVTHDRSEPKIHLAACGDSLLSGTWDIAVTLDGQPLELTDDWECVCWHSDKDADYLELQMTFANRLTIDRQVLLSRTDNFVLLADALSHGGQHRIDYTSRLPLVEGLQTESCVASRECALKRGRMRMARVFPLALPQDRMSSTAGDLGIDRDRLVLHQAASCDGLYAPLIIDWEPKRRRRPADWRTLTVAEAEAAVPSGVAAGHWLRLGDYQILVYRSLKATDVARSVLGHHTRNETVIGRFESTGDVTPIMLVEHS